jgi:hypothetical protein
MRRGGHCGWDRWHWSIMSEEGEGRSGWVGGGGRRGWVSQCVAECLVGESIEIESTCSLKPALEIDRCPLVDLCQTPQFCPE